eukprot:snap_masked-scaffold_76-processed-gene-0.49-mRNA-1 protein AED:1.00 eAED:1.00 QI:0/0/0/0/1/1/2/0/70
MLRKKGIKPTIHPAINLTAQKAKTERQHSATYQQNKDHHAWRNKNEYGTTESVEITFFRFKNSFGRIKII